MARDCKICAKIRGMRESRVKGFTNMAYLEDGDAEESWVAEFREFKDATYGLIIPDPILKRFYGGYSYYCEDQVVLVCHKCKTYYLFYHVYTGMSEYNFTDRIIRDYLIPLTPAEAITELEKTIERARKNKKLYSNKSTFKEIYHVDVKEIEDVINNHITILKNS